MAFGSFNQRLAILIDADGKGAIREMEAVGRAADRDLGRATTRSEKLATGFMRTGTILVGAAAVIGVGLFGMAKGFEGAQLAEIKLQNTIENMPRLSGASAEGFIKQAEALEKVTAADADHIIEAQALLGTFNLTAKEIKGITPLVVDYARKFGTDIPSASIQVGKALDGQMGALKRNGVSIDENLFKTDRYAAVQKALRDQVGGFAEQEGKTFSGRLEQIKHSLGATTDAIGSGVVGALETVAAPLQSTTEWFQRLDEGTKETVGRVATIGTAGVGAAGGLLILAGAGIRVVDRLGEISDRVPRLTGALGALGKVAGAAAVIVGLALALDQLTGGAESAAEETERLAKSSGPELARAYADTQKFLEPFSRGVSTSREMLARFREAAENNIGTARRLRNEWAANGVDTEKFDRILANVTEKQRQVAKDADAQAAALRGESAAFAEATQAADEFKTQIDELIGVHLSAAESEIAYKNALDQVTASFFANGASLDTNTVQGRANQSAIIDSTQAAISYADAIARETGNTQQANAVLGGHVASLSQVLQQTGMTEAQAISYIGTLLRIPPGKMTSITNTADLAAYVTQGLLGKYGEIPPSKNTVMTATTDLARQAIDDFFNFFGGRVAEFRVSVGGVGVGFADGGGVGYQSGGLVGGRSKGAPVLAKVHVGEYVLSADVVDRIRRGSPSRGASVEGGAPGGGHVHHHYHLNVKGADPDVSERGIVKRLRRMELLHR